MDDERDISQAVAREALDQLSVLTERDLHVIRSAWIESEIDLAGTRGFMQNTYDRLHRLQLVIGPDDDNDYLIRQVSAVGTTLQSTATEQASVVSLLGDLSVRLVEIRAVLLQDAANDDPLRELASKIVDQRAVADNLAANVDRASYLRGRLVSAVNQSRLGLRSAEQGRFKWEGQRLVRQPRDESEIALRRQIVAHNESALAAMQDVVTSLAPQRERAVARLRQLEHGL